MTLIFRDRVRETTATVGLSDVVLDGAVTTEGGFQTFLATVGDANTCHYLILDTANNEWETGVGTISSVGPTLARTTVTDGSSGLATKVNFSAGGKEVFLSENSDAINDLVASVALNTTHRSSSGVDHSDVVLNSTHRVNTSNPHSVTKTQVGLSAVTDDAQLKRSANDFTAFPLKGSPVGADKVLIEDSAAAGVKKHVPLSSLPDITGGTTQAAGPGLAIQATDEGLVAGNARGLHSTDLQTSRGGATAVASGPFSAIVGGKEAVADKFGQQSYAAGSLSAEGDAQTSQFVLRRQTTDATPNVEMFLDGAAARMTIAMDATWLFEIKVLARRTDVDNESAMYKFEGGLDNNAGTTATLTVNKTVVHEDSPAWDCNVTADDVNDSLKIDVTGEAAKNINWVAFVRTVEVTG